MRSKERCFRNYHSAYGAQFAWLSVAAQLVVWPVAAAANIQSVNGLYDEDSIRFSLTFDGPTRMENGWTHQLFIDTDNNAATGYADGYDLLVRFVELASSSQVHARATLGGGGPGGWGVSVGVVTFTIPDDQHLEFDVPLGIGSLSSGNVRYSVETYLDDVWRNGRYAQTTYPMSGGDPGGGDDGGGDDGGGDDGGGDDGGGDNGGGDGPSTGNNPLISGHIGVWSMGSGVKYWDDIDVNLLQCSVDLINFAAFVGCLEGPGIDSFFANEADHAACIMVNDLDGDDDVDLRDYNWWLGRYNHKNVLDPCSDGANPSSINQTFDQYECGEEPLGWLDTGADNSMSENDSLFQVACVGRTRALGTSSPATNIHSHRTQDQIARWSAFRYSGRLRIDDPDGGIGVTFMSDYPKSDSYYRLRRGPFPGGESFHIAPHGTAITAGTTNTGVIPVPNVWYHFRIEARATGCKTAIQAKVWAAGDQEPNFWQVDCFDDNEAALLYAEFAQLIACLGGPGADPAQSEVHSIGACRSGFDWDGDGDVDLRDLARREMCVD